MKDSVPKEVVAVETPGMGLSCSGGTSKMNFRGVDVGTQSNGTLCTTAWQGNIFAQAAPVNTSSSVVSITLQGGGNQTGVTFTLPLNGKDDGSRCGFYNYTLKNFSSSGCVEVRRTPKALTCRCTHMTDFAALAGFLPKVNIDVGNFADIKTGGLIYISVAAGIFLTMAIAGFIYDQYRELFP